MEEWRVSVNVELFVPFGREATRTETRCPASGAKVVARVDCDKVVGGNIKDVGCEFPLVS